jgi:hypothetical protein
VTSVISGSGPRQQQKNLELARYHRVSGWPREQVRVTGKRNIPDQDGFLIQSCSIDAQLIQHIGVQHNAVSLLEPQSFKLSASHHSWLEIVTVRPYY